jgi:hypothetical protein
VALGVAVGATLAISPVAQAAAPGGSALAVPAPTASRQGTSSRTFTIPAGQRELVTSGSGAHVKLVKTAAETDQVITCTISVYAPSLESDGRVFAGSTVSCTAFIYEIDEEVALFLNGTEVMSHEDVAPNTSSLGLNIFYSSPAAGNYQTGGIANTYTSASTYATLGPVYSSPVYIA